MAYNRNIPLSTDLISSSQPQLLANFQAIDSGTTGTGAGFSRNHVTLTDATNGGLHNRVDFYQNVADPTLSGFVSSVYSKSNNLYFRGSGGITQLTGIPFTAASNGSVTLNGGIIIKWGSATVNTTGTTVNFVSSFPAHCWSVVVTPESNTSRGIAEGTITTSSFKAYAENNGTTVHYIAIGN